MIESVAVVRYLCTRIEDGFCNFKDGKDGRYNGTYPDGFYNFRDGRDGRYNGTYTYLPPSHECSPDVARNEIYLANASMDQLGA